MKEIQMIADIIKNSDNIVFFGGAGVSTESNIPDFRSADGIYSQKYDYPPEVILSHQFFKKNTAEFYRFYRDKMLFPDAKPNFAHEFLAELEQKGKLRGVITQNIDGLHQKAGSQKVLELHGSVHRNYCQKCGKFYSMNDILNSKGIPQCSCGGVIKPDVVLYGESLDNNCVSKSIKLIAEAEVLIVGGTSLNVYPAAGFLNYFHGKTLILINKDKTSFSDKADIEINGKIGETFKRLAQLI